MRLKKFNVILIQKTVYFRASNRSPLAYNLGAYIRDNLTILFQWVYIRAYKWDFTIYFRRGGNFCGFTLLGLIFAGFMCLCVTSCDLSPGQRYWYLSSLECSVPEIKTSQIKKNKLKGINFRRFAGFFAGKFSRGLILRGFIFADFIERDSDGTELKRRPKNIDFMQLH